MTRAGRTLTAAIVSFVAFSFLLWRIASAFAFSPAHAPCAVLTVDRRVDDRLLVDRLRAAGIEDIVSESTEWIWINDFGEWERVPLDAFRSRIASFDPRDDGYASRVSALFVDADQRRLFLLSPAGRIAGSGPPLERVLSGALPEIPHRVEFIESPSPPPYVALFLVVLCLVLVSFRAKSAVPVVVLPATAALSFFGSGALAAAGFLCAAAVFASRACDETLHAGSMRDRRVPIGDFAMPAVFSAVLYLFAALVSGVPAAAAAAALGSAAAAVLALSLMSYAISVRRGHRRFRPIGLRSARRSAFVALSALLLPFACASLLMSAVSPFLGGRGPSAQRFTANASLSAEEYAAHLENQRTFLTRAVMDAEAQKGYTLFSTDGDGFPVVSDQRAKAPSLPHLERPPAERLAFESGLFGPSVSAGKIPARSLPETLGSMAITLIAVAFSVPSLKAVSLKRKRIKAASIAADKRIAA